MIEMALEEDLPEEFKGCSLRIHPDRSDPPKSPNPDVDRIDNVSDINNQSQNYHWRNTFMAPLSSIPNKITETIWSSKGSKDETPPPTATSTTAPQSSSNEKCIQPSIIIKEDPNNFFTFRDGVIERAVKECTAHLLDETEGPVYASFLLTQINHWDTDKERLLMMTAKNLILVKYDFIALRRLGCRKIMFSDIEGIVVGNLVYPSGSLIPKINGFADGISSLLENCLFKRMPKNDNQADIENLNQTRDRNMKGIRLLLKQDKPDSFASKWNPFNSEVHFLTFTYHPLYYHKDCADERLRSVYNLDLFIENICLSVQKWKENIVILQHNILLENYVGLGSVIHNRHSLGFFKVRGKFSF
ncbi:tumor protein p63-regulated gene 1-like protein isoform X1 [Diorhabda carinulata]|uniref:tumor protein p63-regulated gene 1-like protein isoform X1 n=1 Tax=Diorhabda carinulata TaxID=1163345 RepID=UPI0025A0AC5F|nr:tumor protein p63-regulated gene 1-like protein isoform X1 [Diorhabda carinulata]